MASFEDNPDVGESKEEKEDPMVAYLLSKGYVVIDRIGEGAYGVVYSCTDTRSGGKVAVKKIEAALDRVSACKRTYRELKLLGLLKHENIITLRHVMADQMKDLKAPAGASGGEGKTSEPLGKSTDIYCVFDLMETDLTTIIKSSQHLSNEHCQFFLYQVLRGLLFVHSAGVVHRDLKPRNVLVNSNCDLRVCDFGLARVDEPGTADGTHMTDYVATRWYRAPEVIVATGMYGKAIDMFSVGCILAELLLRKPIFPGADQYDMLKRIAEVLGGPPESMVRAAKSARMHSFLRNLCFQYPRPLYPLKNLFRGCSPKAVDLIQKLLTWDPEQRLTVLDSLKHPYMASLYCPEDEPTCAHIGASFAFEKMTMTVPSFKKLVQAELEHYAAANIDKAFKLDYETKEGISSSSSSNVINSSSVISTSTSTSTSTSISSNVGNSAAAAKDHAHAHAHAYDKKHLAADAAGSEADTMHDAENEQEHKHDEGEEEEGKSAGDGIIAKMQRFKIAAKSVFSAAAGGASKHKVSPNKNQKSPTGRFSFGGQPSTTIVSTVSRSEREAARDAYDF
jgi:serine/threonine protein kinase